MILPDTSVWIDHFRGGEKILAKLLGGSDLLLHPYVIGELALGHLPRRAETVAGLLLQLQAPIVTPEDILVFIDRWQLAASGLSYVDVQLLASIGTMTDAKLWTFDKRLHATAERLGLALEP
jgi:predicted nucleic acid-binding protein